VGIERTAAETTALRDPFVTASFDDRTRRTGRRITVTANRDDQTHCPVPAKTVCLFDVRRTAWLALEDTSMENTPPP